MLIQNSAVQTLTKKCALEIQIIGKFCDSHLLANQLVTFPKHMTALRVSQEHPVCPAVPDHGWAGGRENM